MSAGTEVRVHRALGKIHTLGGVVVKIRKRRGVYLYDVRYFEGASKVARSVEKRVAPDRIVVVDEEGKKNRRQRDMTKYAPLIFEECFVKNMAKLKQKALAHQ
mgnify:CR=1 FL=1